VFSFLELALVSTVTDSASPSLAAGPGRQSQADVTMRALEALRLPVHEVRFGVATRSENDSSAQHRAEHELALRMAPHRRADFLIGRRALRRALAQGGLADDNLPILIGDRNQPRLRSGIAASVSHSGGIAVAIATTTNHFRSVGIDLELSSLPVKAAHLVLNEPERAWLADADTPADREHRLLAAFSAKEAVYKALDPSLTGGTLRRIHMIPASQGFVAWPARCRDIRLPVWVQPVGTGVLALATLRAGTPKVPTAPKSSEGKTQ
jgi:4'-phosphopantetheinyl transferase EntD